MDDQANQVGAGLGAAALGRGGRISRQRKSAAVLRPDNAPQLIGDKRLGHAPRNTPCPAVPGFVGRPEP